MFIRNRHKQQEKIKIRKGEKIEKKERQKDR